MERMDNYIQIINNGYTVKISLKNLPHEDIPDLLRQIEVNNWHWLSFWTNDKLWYCDGSKFLTCVEANHDDNAKIVVFKSV